jgi:hypothetical protein
VPLSRAAFFFEPDQNFKMVRDKISVIITGATGMVGEGVLHECLSHPRVQKVLSLSRRSSGITHPKLSELVLPDLFSIAEKKDQLAGYDACFFCLGVSSIGMKEDEYNRLSYILTMAIAMPLAALNKDTTFCYVSGAGTDSSEHGRSMWARVKGKTENHLLNLFPQAYMFRPGYMQPTPQMKNTLKYYKYVSWMYPFLSKVFPNFVGRLSDLGQAMINCALSGYEKRVLEVKDIKKAAKG